MSETDYNVMTVNLIFLMIDHWNTCKKIHVQYFTLTFISTSNLGQNPLKSLTYTHFLCLSDYDYEILKVNNMIISMINYFLLVLVQKRVWQGKGSHTQGFKKRAHIWPWPTLQGQTEAVLITLYLKCL
jgi:hypothetical protein